MATLIVRFKNKEEAQKAARLLKEAEEIHLTDDLEDLYFGQLIKEGMKESGTIPLEKVKQELTEMLNDPKIK